MIDDWSSAIATGAIVHQRLRELDRDQIWSYSLPRVAASQEEIQVLESTLGMQLNPDHKQFLLHVNGWDNFYQAVDLLGTPQLQGAGVGSVVREQLIAIRATATGAQLPDQLLPVAGSAEQEDMFLQDLTPRGPGEVYWVAGQIVDRFPSFSEFFLAMLDYGREQIHDFEAELDARS